MNITTSMKGLAAAMLMMTSFSSNAVFQEGSVFCINYPGADLDSGLDQNDINCNTTRITVKASGKIYYKAVAVQTADKNNTTRYPWKNAKGNVQLRRNVNRGLDEIYASVNFTGSFSAYSSNRSTNNQTFFAQVLTSWTDTGLDDVKAYAYISTNDAP